MIQRGQVYFGVLGDNGNGVQSGNRPLLVLQNNTGNKYSKTVLVAPITSKRKKEMPTHFTITLNRKSTVLCEQITTIQKSQLGSLLYTLTDAEIVMLDKALIASLGIKCGGNTDG
jgi:mRNA interferase MazF